MHSPTEPLTSTTTRSPDTSGSGGSVPIWTPERAARRFPRLELDIDTDVAVVGAGLVGLLTAYLCAEAGLRVVVLEAGRAGQGDSLRSSAHVTAQLDARWKKIVRDVGPETARSLWTEAMRAIDSLESIVRTLNVDCGWRRVPAWLFTERDEGLEALRDEARAAASAGIPLVSVGSDVPLPWKVAGALRCDDQARLDPAPLLAALASAIDGSQGALFEDTPALEVHDGPETRVVTATGTVRARHVVVATHAPFNNRVLLQTKIACYRTYVLALRTAREPFDGLFWDDADPYHYVRAAEHAGQPVVLVGGEDHRTGQEDDTLLRLAALEGWAVERLPGAAVVASWSGQILEPVDGLPYVGRNSFQRDVLEATGFSGTGWAYGTLAAHVLVATILGHAHPLADTLAATRVTPIASAKRFVRENATFPWHFFGDRLAAASSEVGELARGSGKLVSAGGLRKIAVYRDAQGELHALSAVCPHLGCVVDFNPAESSWDCPCHGSRFDVHGRLLNGPATSGLDPLAAPSDPA